MATRGEEAVYPEGGELKTAIRGAGRTLTGRVHDLARDDRDAQDETLQLGTVDPHPGNPPTQRCMGIYAVVYSAVCPTILRMEGCAE